MSDESNRPEEPPDHELVQARQAGGGGGSDEQVTLSGLFEKVDDRRRRVYLTRDLGSYAEFDVDDFRGYEDIPAESSPIAGVASTRVMLRRGARIDFVHTRRRSVTADDQLDLDARVGVMNRSPSSTGPGADLGALSDRYGLPTWLCQDRTMGSTRYCPDRTMSSLICLLTGFL